MKSDEDSWSSDMFSCEVSPSAVSDRGTEGGPGAVLRLTRELQLLRPATLDARSLNTYSVNGSRPVQPTQLKDTYQQCLIVTHRYSPLTRLQCVLFRLH